MVGMISFSLVHYLEVRKSSFLDSASLQPAQLLQVRHALAQQQATQVAAQHAEVQKRIEAEVTNRAEELVKIEKEKQKRKSAQDTNAAKPDEDATTSRGSAGIRPQGARQRKAIAEASPKKAKVEKERAQRGSQSFGRPSGYGNATV